MFILSFLIRWVLPIGIAILIERYTSGWISVFSVAGFIFIFLVYMWKTTQVHGQGDDDSSGNNNVGRKFTDIM